MADQKQNNLNLTWENFINFKKKYLNLIKKTLSKNTFIRYSFILNQIKTIRDLRDLDEWYVDLEIKKSGTTRKNEIVVINKFIEHINSNHDLKIKKIRLNFKNDSKIIQSLQKWEIKKILTKTNSLQELLALKIFISTGIRIGEYEKVIEKIKNKEIYNSTIKIAKTKGNKERIIFINKEILVLVEGIKNENILWLKNDNIRKKRIKKIGELSELKEPLHAHKFRHTFATNFFHAGGSLKNLQILLGHENLETTLSYIEDDFEFAIEELKQIQENRINFLDNKQLKSILFTEIKKNVEKDKIIEELKNEIRRIKTNKA